MFEIQRFETDPIESQCGSIIYSAYEVNSLTLPSGVSFNPATRYFSVDTAVIPDGLYEIRVRGSINALNIASITKF
jgi:hypothetical protein